MQSFFLLAVFRQHCQCCVCHLYGRRQKIDTEKSCSLTQTYAIDEKKIEGLEIEINGIKSQSEWEEVKDTISAYIAADKIAPTDTQTTDKNGIVMFENLPVGIYYVRWTQNETRKALEGRFAK